MLLWRVNMAERELWAAILERRVLDAISPFVIPDSKNPKTAFNTQYDKFMKLRLEGKLHIGTMQKVETRKAMYFLESSHFDEVAGDLGYDSEFVKRTFNFVQKCVTARNEIMRQGRKPWMRLTD